MRPSGPIFCCLASRCALGGLGLDIVPDLFRVLVKLRLRLPVAVADAACPLCDGVADRFGDHVLGCPCGGDRTKRRNRLRSVLAARAQAAGLRPEVEKPGLLPPRSDQDGLPEDGDRDRNSQRPADDIFLIGECMARPLSTWPSPQGCATATYASWTLEPGLRPTMRLANAATCKRKASALHRASNSSHCFQEGSVLGGQSPL